MKSPQEVSDFHKTNFSKSKVNRIKLDFSATRVNTNDLTAEQVKHIIDESRIQIEHEQLLIAQGKRPPRLQNQNNAVVSRTCNLL